MGKSGMAKIQLFLIVFWLSLYLGICMGEVDVGFRRAIYGPWNYSQDASVGLDADYDNNWWTSGAQRVLDKFKSDSLKASAEGVTYVAGLYYLGDVVDFDYSRAVNRKGEKQEHVPSPVDYAYWQKLIHEPAVAVANLSLECPICGLVWDFELYLAHGDWGADYYSYDRAALEQYAKDSGNQIPDLTAGDRYHWLKDNNLLQDFHDWQLETVREMAEETEEEAHFINPNLSLGILGFSDSWRYWTTLEAFSEDAPVTLWTEKTYWGYREEEVEYLRNQSLSRGLDCKVLPGLYTVALSPWDIIENMEEATRDNGAFWIYQHDGDQYRLADEETYERAYQIFDDYIYFNQSTADPLPARTMYPNIDARPYNGSEGISLLLSPGEDPDQEEKFYIPGSEENLKYIGTNLSIRDLATRNISMKDLPCIIYGFAPDQLLELDSWSLILELKFLLKSYMELGFDPPQGMCANLTVSLSDFTGGRYEEVISRLQPPSRAGYLEILYEVEPVIDQALEDPRNSDIPMASVREISYAGRLYDEGRTSEANVHLIRGLRDWVAAVGESGWLFLIAPIIFRAFTFRPGKADILN